MNILVLYADNNIKLRAKCINVSHERYESNDPKDFGLPKSYTILGTITTFGNPIRVVFGGKIHNINKEN